MAEKILPARRQTIILGSGGATVTGPASATNNEVAVFSGTTGRVIKVADGPVTITPGGSGTTTIASAVGIGSANTSGGTSLDVFYTSNGNALVAIKNTVGGTTSRGMVTLQGGGAGGGNVSMGYTSPSWTTSGGIAANDFYLSTANGATSARLVLQAAGATHPIIFMSGGTAERARFAPSGNLLLGGLTTDGTGVLQLPAATTSAGGIALGTDIGIFRAGANILSFAGTNTSNVIASLDFGGSGDGNRLQSPTDLTIRAAASKALYFFSGNAIALTLNASQALRLNGSAYQSAGALVTDSSGNVTVSTSAPDTTYGSATAQTAAVSNVAQVTVGASDSSYIISCNVLVTASATHSFSAECAYTDEGNTARVVTFNVQQLSGTLIQAITNVTGVGPYEGVPLHIRCKAGTTVTIRTASGGTYTSVTYNLRGAIEQIN